MTWLQRRVGGRRPAAEGSRGRWYGGCGVGSRDGAAAGAKGGKMGGGLMWSLVIVDHLRKYDGWSGGGSALETLSRRDLSAAG
jgi:hypothetical protein